MTYKRSKKEEKTLQKTRIVVKGYTNSREG